MELEDDARPIGVRYTQGAGRDVLSAGHSGYERLTDPVRVLRTFEFERSLPRLRITDRLEGAASHFVEFFFHIAPGAAVRIERESGPEVSWEEKRGWFSPSYGVKIERSVRVASVRVQFPFEIVWSLAAGARTDSM